METCIFCSIAQDSTKLIWENDIAAAFYDIHPKAPVHILVVPKAHIANLDELDDASLAGGLLMAVQAVAAKMGLKGRYRLAANVGRPAGQVVEHLHFHLLGQKNATSVFDGAGAETDQL